ncbi:MAG: hypothetical protein HFI88_10130 [Lachnospiraceae bacterium]|nr:hypothetical protein [Lachnospiraceae bacterium]
MKRVQFLKLPPCPMPAGGGETVTAASQILTAGDGQALEISLFYKGRLGARYFADAENYYTWADGGWSANRIKNAARKCRGESPLKGDCYYFDGEWEWASEEDKTRAFDYLDTYSIGEYEETVNGRKREMAIERKKDRIREEMDKVPAVPEEARAWVGQEIFPGDILFIQKGKGRTAYACTACGARSWKKAGWKHGEKTVCPKCGRPVTVNSRREEKTRTAPVVILQQYGGQWVERQFKAACRWSGAGKETRLYEQCRAVMEKGKRWGKVWYGLPPETDGRRQEFWDKNPGNKRFLTSYLWPGNLAEVLPCGGLERSGLDILARKKQKVNVNLFIVRFENRPWIEYLIKAGLTNLAVEITNGYGLWGGEPEAINLGARNLREALRLDGNRVNRMKKMNGGLDGLRWLQYEQENAVKITDDTLRYLETKKISLDDCQGILEAAGSVNRMVNYMKKQVLPPGKLAVTWRDYLHMAGAEGMDASDDIVRFPRDLKAAHDRLVELRNAREDQERLAGYAGLDTQIRGNIPQAARYYWQDGAHLVVPAASCGELMAEGRALHHCVGSGDRYMKKMAEGKSWILFLRRKDCPEKPWYTLEIDMANDRILQWYSEFDRQPDKEEVQAALDKFKKAVKKRCGKIRIPVAAMA